MTHRRVLQKPRIPKSRLVYDTHDSGPQILTVEAHLYIGQLSTLSIYLFKMSEHLKRVFSDKYDQDQACVSKPAPTPVKAHP